MSPFVGVKLKMLTLNTTLTESFLRFVFAPKNLETQILSSSVVVVAVVVVAVVVVVGLNEEALRIIALIFYSSFSHFGAKFKTENRQPTEA